MANPSIKKSTGSVCSSLLTFIVERERAKNALEHRVYKIAQQAINSGSPGVNPDGTNTDGAPLKAVTAPPPFRSRRPPGYLTAATVGLLDGVADRILSGAVPPTAATAAAAPPAPLTTATIGLLDAVAARINAKAARINAKTARTNAKAACTATFPATHTPT